MKKILLYPICFYLIYIFIEINLDVDEINHLNVFSVPYALADDEGFKIPDYNVEELKYENKKKYFITGFINQKIAYGFSKSDPKLTMVRTIFHPEVKYEFENEWFLEGSGNAYYDLAYTIEGRDQFYDETLENNEHEIELRELFLNAKINYFLNIKVGRQIVAWGESNFAQITDVVNPRDKTQLGLVDLEDARIPVTSIRISYLNNPWIFDIVSIHEIRGNKLGGYGSDFDYFINFRGSDIIVNDEEWNESEFGNTEMVLKISRTFNASDLTLLLGSFYEDGPYLDFSAFENDDGQFEYKIEPMHNRISAIALSANRAFGETLIKTEFGAFFNKTFNSNNFVNQENGDGINQLQNLSSQKKNLLKGLLGVEFSGISETTITIEGLVTSINDYENDILREETTSVLYSDVTHEMLNDLIKLNFNWQYYYPGDGQITRSKIAYKLTDNLKIEGGIIFYDASNNKTSIFPYRDQDRVFLSLKYHFN